MSTAYHVDITESVAYQPDPLCFSINNAYSLATDATAGAQNVMVIVDEPSNDELRCAAQTLFSMLDAEEQDGDAETR